MFMSIVLWAQVAVFTHTMSYDVDWDKLGTMGRAPRTRETLLDFRESGRVTRHSRVFCRLTGSQRTPGDWHDGPFPKAHHSPLTHVVPARPTVVIRPTRHDTTL